MFKKRIPFILTAVLALALFFPGFIRAQGELTVTDSSAQMEFPFRISFSLSAESDVEITDIRFHYRVDRTNFAPVTSEIYINFHPAKEVTAVWSLEMIRTGGMPPGTGVEYWWTVTDARDNQVMTEPETVVFDDNRYNWQHFTEGKIALYWYSGDRDFAEELMVAAQQALVSLKEFTGAELEDTVRLYIYTDSTDLQGAMIYPQEWTGGVAFTRYGVMAIGISPENLEWGLGTIAHELTHLVIHQVMLNPYSDLPPWLDEGLALHSEGPLDPTLNGYLDQALAYDSLISVQSLSSPFSAYSDTAALSYAQSYSIVEYLVTTYGQDKMFELLSTFQAGANTDEALEAVYSFDVDGLDAVWQEWVTSEVPVVALPASEPVPAG